MRRNNKKLIGVSLITAFASSLCCITPLLALISGSTGFASSFDWMKPYRPFLIVFTVVVLGYSWYQKLKPKKAITCNCNEEKPSFLQSKTFLFIMTIFALTMTVYPYLSTAFYAKNDKKVIFIDKANLETATISVNGMTCTACETHINHAINEIEGVVNAKSSYKNGNTLVEFDKSKTSIEAIKNTINKTGYSVKNTKNEN